ncbi:nuclear transport factor 2 family protein [Actinomadura keratinilytica]|uniref:SnoaL-like domain-containing protein n=1 Tax=Actinomadura keratinilytica TaxID=547461 RepID=A0ABP7YW24_9ACTN
MTSRSEIADLLRRVRRLEESETARNHLHRYAEALDDPDPEAVAALFTEDGALHTRLAGRPGRTMTGRAAIAAFYRDRIAADPSPKRHFIVGPRTTWVAPGEVEIASYFLFTARADVSSVIGWGTYRDRLRVDGGTALFADKTIDLQVSTDLEKGWARP